MLKKKFNHCWAKIPKLKQINTDAGRRYLVEGTEVKYPSITTLLGAVSDKTALYEWRKRVGAEKAAAVTKAATRRGSTMHDMCERYLRNELDDDVHVADGGGYMFNSLRPILDRIDNVRCLETPLYSTALRVAGTVDCIAELDGKLTVIDFKTANRAKKEEWIQNYFQQGCFYLWAYYELTGEMPEQVAILVSVEDGTTQEFILNKKDIKHHSDNLKQATEKYYRDYATTNS